MYQPASSLLLVERVSSPGKRPGGGPFSILGVGVILPDSVDVDRSSSASKEEECERKECLDTMDWTESKRVFAAGRLSWSSFRGTIIGRVARGGSEFRLGRF